MWYYYVVTVYNFLKGGSSLFSAVIKHDDSGFSRVFFICFDNKFFRDTGVTGVEGGCYMNTMLTLSMPPKQRQFVEEGVFLIEKAKNCPGPELEKEVEARLTIFATIVWLQLENQLISRERAKELLLRIYDAECSLIPLSDEVVLKEQECKEKADFVLPPVFTYGVQDALKSISQAAKEAAEEGRLGFYLFRVEARLMAKLLREEHPDHFQVFTVNGKKFYLISDAQVGDVFEEGFKPRVTYLLPEEY